MSIQPEIDHYQRLLRYEQSHRRRLGRPRLVQYLINRRYYYGDNIQPDDVNQPLSIRYVPRIINKHTHYLFGEWEQDLVDWVVSPLDKESEEDKEISTHIARAIYRLMRRCDADQLLYRGALDGSIYGDTVFKLRFNPRIQGASFENVLPEYYHAMWNPLDVSETTEALVAYNLDRQVAYELFGTVGNPQFHNHLSYLDPGYATVWEHWNSKEYHLVVDDQLISQGSNPYIPITASPESSKPAWLPFIHIPNLGVNGDYFGFGDAEAIYDLQDELNMRIADFGDIINYHAHPITLVKNYFGRFEDLRTGPDVVWDMGREGEASYLEWGGPAPGIMNYIELLMKVLFDTSSLTGVAFGRSEQSQASGSALVVQMLPIVEIVRRKRAAWGPNLRELAKRLLELEAMSMPSEQFLSIYKFSSQDLARFSISPKWSPILPRDRMSVVNENVALLVNKARSIVTAMKDLGIDDPEEEKIRIIQDLKEFAEIQAEMQKTQMDNDAAIQQKYAQPGPNDDASEEMIRGTQRPMGRKSASEYTPNRDGGKNMKRASGGSNEDS